MGLNCANGKHDSGTKLATGLPHEFLTEQTRAFVAERATKSFSSDSWTKFTSPEICLPFAQPSTDQFAHINGQQPGCLIVPPFCRKFIYEGNEYRALGLDKVP